MSQQGEVSPFDYNQEGELESPKAQQFPVPEWEPDRNSHGCLTNISRLSQKYFVVSQVTVLSHESWSCLKNNCDEEFLEALRAQEIAELQTLKSSLISHYFRLSQ